MTAAAGLACRHGASNSTSYPYGVIIVGVLAPLSIELKGSLDVFRFINRGGTPKDGGLCTNIGVAAPVRSPTEGAMTC